LIGFILILVRIIDIVQDIFVGYFSDILAKHKLYRKKIISISVICLSLVFYALFNPPQIQSQILVILWFFLVSTLTYTFFNFAVINYEAIAAIVSNNKKDRISINSAKEFFGLIGFLVATIMPYAISSSSDSSFEDSYFFLSIFFVIIILLVNFIIFSRVNIDNHYQKKVSAKINIKSVFQHKNFMFFLVIFVINAAAVSFPTATIIFYVEDVLQLKDKFGIFLFTYFFAAISFIFFWKYLSQKYGKIRIWIISILGSVITFLFAFFIDASTANYFYLVCLFSGIFLGPDLINPPALVADLTQNNKNEISSFFAMFNMTAKIGLMISSSASLIILGYFGYQPGQSESEISSGQNIIPYVYALIPCLLKIVVVFLLVKFSKKIT